MNSSTEDQYRKLARHFYKDLDRIHPSTITAKLNFVADKYRPSYWRKLRNAIAFDLKDRSYSKPAKMIADLKLPPDAKTVKKKPRVKSVSPADVRKLLTDNHLSRQSKSAIRLALHLGCRPAELFDVKVEGQTFTIKSVKKATFFSKKLKKMVGRGADRTIEISDRLVASTLAKDAALLAAYSNEVKDAHSAIRKSLERASKRLFPRRVAKPSLYSFRHQYAANLKADSSLSDKRRSYFMGHQATSSINTYGDKRRGRSEIKKIARPAEAVKIRDTKNSRSKAFSKKRSSPGQTLQPK